MTACSSSTHHARLRGEGSCQLSTAITKFPIFLMADLKAVIHQEEGLLGPDGRCCEVVNTSNQNTTLRCCSGWLSKKKRTESIVSSRLLDHVWLKNQVASATSAAVEDAAART